VAVGLWPSSPDWWKLDKLIPLWMIKSKLSGIGKKCTRGCENLKGMTMCGGCFCECDKD